MATILIADDEGLFVALETTPVLRAGLTLIPVRSSRDLLCHASTRQPDLILLDADILEPGLLSSLKSLKADRRLSSVPIVLAAREPARFRNALGGGDVVFGKPVDPETLGAALKFLLPVPRRGGARIALSVPVTCRIGGRTITLKTKDVGPGGVFLKTQKGPACGTRFEATFQLPCPSAMEFDQVVISAVCAVVRRVGPEETDLIAGVGAAFVAIEKHDEERLKRFVASGIA